jgi:hypothetical protein
VKAAIAQQAIQTLTSINGAPVQACVRLGLLYASACQFDPSASGDLQTTQLPSKRAVAGTTVTVSLSFMWSLRSKHDDEKKDERWCVGE